MRRVADCPRQLIGACAARHTQSGTIVHVGMASAQGPEPRPHPMVQGAFDTGGSPHLGRRQESVPPDILFEACRRGDPAPDPERLVRGPGADGVFLGMKPDRLSAFVGRGECACQCGRSGSSPSSTASRRTSPTWRRASNFVACAASSSHSATCSSPPLPTCLRPPEWSSFYGSTAAATDESWNDISRVSGAHAPPLTPKIVDKP